LTKRLTIKLQLNIQDGETFLPNQAKHLGCAESVANDSIGGELYMNTACYPLLAVSM